MGPGEATNHTASAVWFSVLVSRMAEQCEQYWFGLPRAALVRVSAKKCYVVGGVIQYRRILMIH